MNDYTSYEEQLNAGKTVISYTVGDSMEPLLYNRKTHVFIRKAEGTLKRNDIPLYRRPTGEYVLHRIIRVGDDCYYIRGDNRVGLETVPKDWVLGVVTQIYRNGKYISVTDFGYRMYLFFLHLTYPFRRVRSYIKARMK